MTWEIGQTVNVESRTWAGINKPGGCAKITKIHYAAADGANIEALDVKYILGGSEKNIDPAIVSPYETLQRGGRKRRGRDFLLEQGPEDVSKRTIKPQEAQRQKLPSTQSSPTTPTTPEQNLKGKKKEAPKVTPIPSVINLDRIMDVSPLIDDRCCAKNKRATQEQSLARRGLFESLPRSPPRREMSLATASAVASKYASTQTPTSTSVIVPTTKYRSLNATDRNIAKRQTPLSAEKKPIQYPRLKTKSSNTPKNVKSTSLKRVHENEVRKARAFIDDMIRPRPSDIIPVTSKENARQPAIVDQKKPPAEETRLKHFLSIFYAIRLNIDDDTIEETKFHQLINSQASNPFSKQEVDKYVETLSKQNKLMKSDGIIYIVN